MQRNVYVPLKPDALAALAELARREFRDPKAQAAVLILEGLRRAGLPVDAESRVRAELTRAGDR